MLKCSNVQGSEWTYIYTKDLAQEIKDNELNKALLNRIRLGTAREIFWGPNPKF
jgi:hypothetical protein